MKILKTVFMETQKTFPNGFASWMETHYEIVAAFYCDPKSKRLEQLENHKGRGGLYELAEELTDKFEKLHEGWVWDGDYYDTLEEFLNIELQILN